MKKGLPVGAHCKSENIRLIKLKDKLPRKVWYKELAGKRMKVYLFPRYSDAISVARKEIGSFNNEISGEHFDLVKYIDKSRNTDVRERSR